LTPRRRWARIAVFGVVIAVGLAFALSYGLSFGVSNQNHYLLPALHRVDPGLLARDWLVTKTTHFHGAFGYLGWLLLWIHRGGWAFVAMQIVVIAATCFALHALVDTLTSGEGALATYCLLMTLLFVTRTSSVGASYLTEHYLQPSSLGALGMLAAGALFVRGRWLASGVALAAGGLFHTSYLLLGGPLFFFAHLLLGTRRVAPRAALQLVVPAVALLTAAPVLLGVAGSPAVEAARRITFEIRGPHHFLPATYERGFLATLSWQMIGLGSLPLVAELRGASPGAGADPGRPPEEPRAPGARFGALFASYVALIWTGVLFSTAYFVPQVAHLFVTRIAPFSDVFAQLLFAGGVVAVLRRPARLFALPAPAAAACVAGLSGLVMYCANHGHRPLGSSVSAMAAVTIGWALAWRAFDAVATRCARLGALASALGWLPRFGVSLLALGALGAVGWDRTGDFAARSNMLSPQGPGGGMKPVYDWIAASTPRDALFVTPPGLETFRLQARRAIIADWKAVPHLPDEVMEWYRRLEDVSARRGFRGRHDLDAGYRSMTPERLTSLRNKYGADHALLEACGDAFTARFRRIYGRGAGWCVLALGETPGAEPPAPPPGAPPQPSPEPPAPPDPELDAEP
jgi:hypothetical protein